MAIGLSTGDNDQERSVGEKRSGEGRAENTSVSFAMSEVSTAVDSAGPVVPENGEDDSVAAQEVEGVSLNEAGDGSGGLQGEAAGEEEPRSLAPGR